MALDLHGNPIFSENNLLAPQRGEWQPDGYVFDANGNRTPTYQLTRWENKSHWNGFGGPIVRTNQFLDESSRVRRGNEGVFEQWSRPNGYMRRDGPEQGRMLAVKPNSGIITGLKKKNRIGLDEDPRVMARKLRIGPRLEDERDRLFRRHMGIQDKLLPRSGFEPLTTERSDEARLQAIMSNPRYVPSPLEMATMVGDRRVASDDARDRVNGILHNN